MIGSAGAHRGRGVTIRSNPRRNLRPRHDAHSPMSPSLPPASPNPLQRALLALLRFVFVIGGMLLMLGAMMLALVLAVGVVLWALLRGRRPEPVNLRWGTMPRPPGFGRRNDTEVVDVQVREIDAPNPP